LAEISRKVFRVLHLNASNFYGGPEKQIVEHIKILNLDKFTGFVAAFQEGVKKNDILVKAGHAGIKNQAIPSKHPLDLNAMRNLQLILFENKIDLLCTHGFKSTVYGWQAGRKIGIPVIAFSRGFTAENKKVAFYESIERKILRRVDGIISVSHGQKKKLENFGIKRNESWVVHNAVSVNNIDLLKKDYKQQILEKFNLPKDAILAVTAGRLSPEKGHEFLVEAASKLKEYKNLYYIFAGEGVCREKLENKAEHLNIISQCRFIGFWKDILNLFNIMDFFVLPSLTEGLPNVILESFSLKKSVVATDVGGVSELLKNKENGLLVPACNSDLLAEGISSLYKSELLRKKMGDSGYNTVSNYFSFEKQKKSLEDIYLNILEKNKK